MIISIANKEFVNYKVLYFPSKEKVIGAREIDTEKLEAQIFNYETEEVETKLLNTFGLDISDKIIWLELLKK